MNDKEQRKAAKEFAKYWSGKGYEKGESQPFWIELLNRVFGIENPAHYISFENQVCLDHTSFIDGFIDKTHVLIEQKGIGKDLRKPIRQSDGTLLNPFQQAQRYSASLPYSKRPRWIVTCNFSEFLIYDMERPNGEPESVLLENLEKEYYRLQFLVDADDENIKKEMEVSIQAGDIVGILYDKLLERYVDPQNEHSLKSLNMLCVRLVFCLYAEDAGIFGGHKKFHNYLQMFDEKTFRQALIDLFRVLDTKPEERDPYLDDALCEFPYVNGGLFADENIEIPKFNDEIINLILEKASENFDWSGISPTIFGAVFESTLNPQTRRSGGMHYTSIENIHKVIDPLFLDDLRSEFKEIREIKVSKTKEKKLKEFISKLSTLTFLDPACGSGNFLTETYMSLRKLENDALREQGGQMEFFDGRVTADIIKVSIRQFYGIEINDFAVTVAKTALWIAECQMLKETEDIVKSGLEFLPLKSYANIVEGNALKIDWESVVPKTSLSYIMGNPPFVGAMLMSGEQRNEIKNLYSDSKGVGELDYVSGWYMKAAEYIKSTDICAAFVSTNSICQGQQAVTLWKPLMKYGIKIQFAHRSFIWGSEANDKAHVHCVIAGFSYADRNNKSIFDNNKVRIAQNINSYLADSPDIFVESTSKPLCNVPQMRFGSMPRDGGGFVLSDDEHKELIKNEPLAEKWVHKYIGAYEFINNKTRWCLWLVNANPNELRKCPSVMKRIEFVKNFRLNSKAASTRKFAETPTLFCQIAQPDTDYILVPRVSSENRRYVPIGFVSKMTIASDACLLVPMSSLYAFGILTSNVHMAWMRTVAGRLKSDYRYSKDIVYNNFPWCTPTEEQKLKIEQTSQGILDARSLYPDCSLADLYDELTMPPELRKAHQENDRAVMQAYGFPVKNTFTESMCVAELMKMYEKLKNENTN